MLQAVAPVRWRTGKTPFHSRSAGEEFKISKALPSPISVTSYKKQHLLEDHELHDRVSQISEHRKCRFSLKYGLKALDKRESAE